MQATKHLFMQKRKGTLLLFLLFMGFTVFAQSKNSKINWISFEELEVAYAANPKPILIDVYTDWCGWCKKMDKDTYQNTKLVNYVNEKYYAIKFNAESKDSVRFNNKTYLYNKKNKINELAIYLTFGRLEFPHTVFLSALDGRPAPLSGYLKPVDMEEPVKFFGELAYGKETFPAFSKKLKKEW